MSTGLSLMTRCSRPGATIDSRGAPPFVEKLRLVGAPCVDEQYSRGAVVRRRGASVCDAAPRSGISRCGPEQPRPRGGAGGRWTGQHGAVDRLVGMALAPGRLASGAVFGVVIGVPSILALGSEGAPRRLLRQGGAHGCPGDGLDRLAPLLAHRARTSRARRLCGQAPTLGRYSAGADTLIEMTISPRRPRAGRLRSRRGLPALATPSEAANPATVPPSAIACGCHATLLILLV
jgi:hypothetical protein